MHPEALPVLTRLVADQRATLADDLVGSYVFGSAVVGGYEPGVSDVDTVAVLAEDPTPAQLERLERLHDALVRDLTEWDDRVETVYLSADALSSFRDGPRPAARVSPGEPFHAISVDERWLIDWYQLRNAGVAMLGPPPASLVPAIAHAEYVAAVGRHLLDPHWLVDPQTDGDRAYTVLTMCRGLRTIRTGEHVSKREAALWGREVLPAHADVIDAAAARRSRQTAAVDVAATRRLVRDVQRLVADDLERIRRSR